MYMYMYMYIYIYIYICTYTSINLSIYRYRYTNPQTSGSQHTLSVSRKAGRERGEQRGGGSHVSQRGGHESSLGFVQVIDGSGSKCVTRVWAESCVCCFGYGGSI